MATVEVLNTGLLAAAGRGDVEEVQCLLDEGADPSYQDAEGVSALMRAAESGHLPVVNLLLENGAPWNAQDSSGYCAGEYATAGKHQEVVEYLLQWAVQAELILSAMQRRTSVGTGKPTNAQYLAQKLVYEGEKLLDEDGEAVMMGWETPLMEKHAEIICQPGGHVLNVGFGLGIIDRFIQARQPASHTIIEAHPDVYAHMKATGWCNKPNVLVLFGRWQDVLPQLGQYDGIFFDTYGEYYEELHQFHCHLPQLLTPTGTYSFFNGFASDNIFFHMVYGRLMQVELAALGIHTTFLPQRLNLEDQTVWKGVKNKYWHFEVYFYPVCTFEGGEGLGAGQEEEAMQVEQQQEPEGCPASCDMQHIMREEGVPPLQAS